MAEDGEGIAYFLRWQTPLCALINVAPAAAAAIVLCRCREMRLRSTDLWLPCWSSIHPLWLLGYRAFAALFTSSLLLYLIHHDGAWTFYFYTQWTFTLLTIYFVLATCISAHGCWIYSKEGVTENGEANGLLNIGPEDEPQALTSERCKNGNDAEQLPQGEKAKTAGFWGYTLQIIYQTCGGAVLLTDIVFWGFLVPFTGQGASLSLVDDSIHSLNLVFLVLDTALNRMSFPWFRMAYFIFFSSIYVSFQWILHACGFTWWPYPFLELETPWAPLWYLGIAVVHIPCYVLYGLISRGKSVYMPKLFPSSYIRSS